jgi:hypothetical protein
MDSGFGTADVLSFLAAESERGVLPTETASALMIGSRAVFAHLSPEESADLRRVDVACAVARFATARAEDFSARSLEEYARRTHRAWELFSAWKANPAHFRPKTRVTAASLARAANARGHVFGAVRENGGTDTHDAHYTFREAYESTLPIRRGHLVTISNIPTDLTAEEAERLASFVRMLGASE